MARATAAFLLLVAASASLAQPAARAPAALPVEFDERTLRAFDRSSRHLATEERADGSQLMRYDGTHQTVVVARRNPDGTREIICTEDRAQAVAFLERRDAPRGEAHPR